MAWHEAYDDPSSSLSARLQRVRAHLSAAIDRAPAGPVRLLSLCAGQGRDVLAVLPGHPRRDDISAVLVEADAGNAELARGQATEAGLPQVEVRHADASRVASFADALPADVLMLCGIFGNVSHQDIETIVAAPALCASGASVIWTRNRRPPDQTPRIRTLFAAAGFDEVIFDEVQTAKMTGVGVNRLRAATAGAPGGKPSGNPAGSLPGEPLFTFRERGPEAASRAGTGLNR
jgi:hypothetical protein